MPSALRLVNGFTFPLSFILERLATAHLQLSKFKTVSFLLYSNVRHGAWYRPSRRGFCSAHLSEILQHLPSL